MKMHFKMMSAKCQPFCAISLEGCYLLVLKLEPPFRVTLFVLLNLHCLLSFDRLNYDIIYRKQQSYIGRQASCLCYLTCDISSLTAYKNRIVLLEQKIEMDTDSHNESQANAKKGWFLTRHVTLVAIIGTSVLVPYHHVPSHWYY